MMLPPDSFAILPPLEDGDQPGGADPSFRPAPNTPCVCGDEAVAMHEVHAGQPQEPVEIAFCQRCADLNKLERRHEPRP